jgi:hypothetical protein
MDVVVVVLASLFVLAALAVLGFAVLHRDRLWRSSSDERWPPDDDGLAGVREPRRPKPAGGVAAAAVDPRDD